MNEMASGGREEPGPHAGTQRSRFPLPIVVGVILGIAFSLFLARRFFGDSSPELTSERLAEAQARWQKAQWKNYRVEVDVQSRQREQYAVEVRNGEPRQAWRNGRALTQTRVFDTWSVPGMFTTLADDLDVAHRGGDKANAGAQLHLRCTFDVATGAPLRYRRIEWGNNFEILWQITKLEPTDGERPNDEQGDSAAP